MLHWRITDRDFALRRVPRTCKAQQLQYTCAGNASTKQTERLLSFEGLSDARLPRSWMRRLCKAGSEFLMCIWWAIQPPAKHQPATWRVKHQEERQRILCLFFWPFCRVWETGERLSLPSSSENKSQVEESLSCLLWVTKRRPEAGDQYNVSVIQRPIIDDKYRTTLSTAPTQMDLSEQQALNSKITLSLSLLVYELTTLSQNTLASIFPPIHLGDRTKVLLLERIKAFMQLSAWR